MRHLARPIHLKKCSLPVFGLLALLLFTAVREVRAQSGERKESWTFANCHLVESDLAQSATNVDTSKRIVAMEQLLKDMRKIFDERTLAPGLSPYPANYLENCFRKKNEALVQFGRNAPESFKDSATYYKIFAQETLLNAQLSTGKTRVEYYKQADDLLAEVVKRDPKDWSAKEDRFRTYVTLHRYKWELSDKNGQSTLAKNSVSASELDEYRRTSLKLVQEIINDPQVSAEKKITCYKFLIANTESMMMKNNETVADWKKVLELNPKDTDALTSVGNYYYHLKQFKEALPYFEKLTVIKPDSELATTLYLDCLYQVGDFQTLRSKSSVATKSFPKNALIRSRSARAKLELKMAAEAREENSIALKLNPKDPLARSTQAILLEGDGDSALAENLLSSALQTYEKAYRMDPSRPTLRTKMARVIYQYRKEKNFQPESAARAEMKQIIDLLYELAANPNTRPQLKEEGVEILLEAANFNRDTQKLSASCSFYEEMVGIISNSRLQKICGEAYVKSGNPSKARELLTQALKSENSGLEKQRIKQLLNQLR